MMAHADDQFPHRWNVDLKQLPGRMAAWRALDKRRGCGMNVKLFLNSLRQFLTSTVYSLLANL